MRRSHLATAVASVLTVGMVLSGCSTAKSDSASSGSTSGTKQLAVVASTTQVSDFARNVGGDAIKLTQLIQPNASAHQFEATAAELTALSAADVLVVNGAGLEGWLDTTITASGFTGTVIDASTGISLSGEHSDEAGEDAGHTDSGHTDEATEGNPHIWTDPQNAQKMVSTIAEGFAAAEPSLKATFEANAKAYDAKLATLDTWIATNVDRVPAAKRMVVSNHDAFHYYLERYDITFVGSIMPSFEDNAEPSAAELQTLINKIKELGVTAIFSESSISDKTAQQIGQSAGVKVYSGENALYGDSLGPEGSDGDTYIKATIHNTRAILESWGLTADAVPTDLDS